MEAPKRISLLTGLQNVIEPVWQKWFTNLDKNAAQKRISTKASTTNYFAKIATFSFPTTNNIGGKVSLIVTPIGVGASATPSQIDVSVFQGSSGLYAASAININRHTAGAYSFTSFYLVQSSATNGTDVEFWMTNQGGSINFDFYEISKSLVPGVSVTYHDNAEWTATDPTSGAAVSITSNWTADWADASFENGWVNYGSVFNTAQYMRDAQGWVRLRGLIKSGTVTVSAFTLPAGYRPTTRYLFVAISNNAIGRVDVDVNGQVIPTNPCVNNWVSLDGIAFRAEQ